jgi:hypothetical protein
VLKAALTVTAIHLDSIEIPRAEQSLWAALSEHPLAALRFAHVALALRCERAFCGAPQVLNRSRAWSP